MEFIGIVIQTALTYARFSALLWRNAVKHTLGESSPVTPAFRMRMSCGIGTAISFPA
ncbi:hypothetical protein EDO6_03201 [Paenibacillus xylanexedens]|nr:hypothetical protein EDO6_03201 [Paenibacillus xylanexedens]